MSSKVAERVFERRQLDFFDGPYFVRLKHNLMTREEFTESQRPFHSAVKNWSNYFCLLASRVDDLEVKRILIENVADEVGLGKTSGEAHEETFLRFLRAVGGPETFPVEKRQVTDFTARVAAICREATVADALLTLGTIEYVYAHVSDFLARKIQDGYGVGGCAHYAVHGDLDIDHAEALFHAADKILPRGSEARIEIYVESAVQMFQDLYDDLETVPYAGLISFGNVWEDAEVEKALLPPSCSPRVCCVASGGCTVLSLASAGAHVDAVDLNKDQLDITREKISTPGLRVKGKYERLFELVPYFRGRYGRIFNRRRLSFIFSSGAVGDATDETFSTLFTRAITHQKTRRQEDRLTRLILAGKPTSSAHLPDAVSPVNLHHSDLTAFLSNKSSAFDLVSLSNVTDWMPKETTRDLATAALQALKPAGRVVCRTMHGADPSGIFLDTGFSLDPEPPEDASGLYTVRVFVKPAFSS